MKILFILLGLFLIAFVVVQFSAYKARKDIESYPYTVIKKYDIFETRNYETTLFTAVTLPPSKGYKNTSSKGFSILGGYIFGGNKQNQKIAMTSPVAMSLEDSVTMMFMVPKKLTKETLPEPNQSQIEFREEPAKTVAAIGFGGWVSDAKIEKYKSELKSALDREGLGYTNRFFLLGYNPPYEVFGRKNELIVELK